jgi:hypothetical protein
MDMKVDIFIPKKISLPNFCNLGNTWHLSDLENCILIPKQFLPTPLVIRSPSTLCLPTSIRPRRKMVNLRGKAAT